jgi:hypothetical protein
LGWEKTKLNTLCKKIGKLIGSVSTQECKNYFQATGYSACARWNDEVSRVASAGDSFGYRCAFQTLVQPFAGASRHDQQAA